MGPKRFCALGILALWLFLPLVSAASDAGLTGNLEAFRVVTNEDGRENFLPADRARPKDIIEYRLTYRNDGSGVVRNLFITDPIPSGAEYIDATASRPDGGRVEFSVDGGRTYEDWPIVITRRNPDGTTAQIEATPDMVTHIRWIISDAFDPSGGITVSYRTFVK
ncbi:MAG: hypothetical protein ACE5EO_00125 [Candidatus Krumholzibacteriia bacterium]